MKITPEIIKALEIIKLGKDRSLFVYVFANTTDSTFWQIHAVTFSLLKDQGLVTETDGWQIELTFKGQCVLAAAKNQKGGLR